MRSTLATVWLVAQREVRLRLRSRAVLVFTALLAVLIIGIGVLNRVTTGDRESKVDVGVSGEAPPRFADALASLATASDRAVTVEPVDDRAAAEQAIEDGRFDVVVMADSGELLYDGDLYEVTATIVGGAWQLTKGVEQASALGLTPDQIESIVSPVALRAVAIDGGEPDSEVGQIVGTLTAILLFMSVSIFGGYVLSGVVEEKTSAVVEILLAHVRPHVLLAGKVLGIGIVALMQFAVAVVAALISLAISGTTVPGDVWVAVPTALGWFIAGFALYSTLFGLAGSFVSRQEDANAAAAPITTSSLIAYLVVFGVSETPDSTVATVLSLLPPFAPLLMPLRMATGAAPLWQVALSAVLLVLGVYGVLRAAGAVYARTLLHRGSRLTWRQALSLRND